MSIAAIVEFFFYDEPVLGDNHRIFQLPIASAMDRVGRASHDTLGSFEVLSKREQ